MLFALASEIILLTGAESGLTTAIILFELIRLLKPIPTKLLSNLKAPYSIIIQCFEFAHVSFSISLFKSMAAWVIYKSPDLEADVLASRLSS